MFGGCSLGTIGHRDLGAVSEEYGTAAAGRTLHSALRCKDSSSVHNEDRWRKKGRPRSISFLFLVFRHFPLWNYSNQLC